MTAIGGARLGIARRIDVDGKSRDRTVEIALIESGHRAMAKKWPVAKTEGADPMGPFAPDDRETSQRIVARAARPLANNMPLVGCGLWNGDRGEDFVVGLGRFEQPQKELASSDLAGALQPFQNDGRVQRQGTSRILGGRVGIGKRTADCAAISDRVVGDQRCGFGKERCMFGDQRVAGKIGMACQRPDDKPVAIQTDTAQCVDAGDVDEQVACAGAEIERCDEALPACKNASFAIGLAKKRNGMRKRLRPRVASDGSLHKNSLPRTLPGPNDRLILFIERSLIVYCVRTTVRSRREEDGMNGFVMDGTESGARLAIDRRRLPPEERQQQIVDTAVRFFAEVGLEGKTRELAKRLGVTQSLIFKYFETKQDLIEAVYARVYLERISPDWPALIRDRSRPIGERMSIFYQDYGSRIFDHDWMRIFMFSGLAGAALNKRYLNHLSKTLLEPILEEIRTAACTKTEPTLEDLWSLHGGIVYIGIRQHIYQMPVSDNPQREIDRAIARFLRSFDIDGPNPTVA